MTSCGMLRFSDLTEECAMPSNGWLARSSLALLLTILGAGCQSQTLKKVEFRSWETEETPSGDVAVMIRCQIPGELLYLGGAGSYSFRATALNLLLYNGKEIPARGIEEPQARDAPYNPGWYYTLDGRAFAPVGIRTVFSDPSKHPLPDSKAILFIVKPDVLEHKDREFQVRSEAPIQLTESLRIRETPR
jgi:hypothetical protein